MQSDAKQSNTLQQRIDRATAKLAALKAQQQARDAREKLRRNSEARATRNRALILLGVALEREVRDAPERAGTIRHIIEKHLHREGDRVEALAFLSTLTPNT